MDDLVTWLLAQVAEDEREATAAFSGQCDPENGWGIEGRAITPHVGVIHEDVQRAHVAKWNPARVLAECESKRVILDGHTHDKATRTWPNRPDLTFGCADCHMNDDGDIWAYGWCHTVRGMALAYVDRPGYREDWRAS